MNYIKSQRVKTIRCNITFKYIPEFDYAILYFGEIRKDNIKKSDTLLGDSIVVDVDVNGHLLYMQIADASDFLPCHFFDFPGYIDGKPPLKLQADYDLETDSISISFVAQPDYPLQIEFIDLGNEIQASFDRKDHLLDVRLKMKNIRGI